MLKSWKTSIQSREIRSEGWCLGAWCLHLPARERQTRPKMRLFFANALGVSGHLRTETVLIDTCVNCCPEQAEVLQEWGNWENAEGRAHLGGDDIFYGGKGILGTTNE